MGQARELMDRMTDCMRKHDFEGLASLYASDAVITTPDEGQIKGREGILGYLRRLSVALPDFEWEELASHESGDTAVDEGWVVGTNTGPIETPTETVPATGRRVRVRGCDVATVRDGQISSHNFYFDQLELFGQLGLLANQPA
ncbi:MAG TPA: nuclear transport factor 2 family protein [Acidimicrobiales bacterium]|nr:nuclear transport factor 2 family protein [Acidimicrobiales bacterium]